MKKITSDIEYMPRPGKLKVISQKLPKLMRLPRITETASGSDILGFQLYII